jgi:hypothetical protein
VLCSILVQKKEAVQFFQYLNLHNSRFILSQQLPPLFVISRLPFMPITRQSAAAGAEKSASEDNTSPPPAPGGRQSNKKAQATTTTASKSKKTRAGKKASEVEGEQDQARQSADTQPAPVEPPVEPSETAHSSDDVDKSVGIPLKDKLPDIVSQIFTTEVGAILKYPVL